MIYLGDQAVGLNKKTNINPFSKSIQLSYNWAYAIFEDNEEITIDCKDCFWINYDGTKYPPMSEYTFYNSRNLKSITITNFYNLTKFNMSYFAARDGYFGAYADNLTNISFEGITLIPSNFVGTFLARTKLKSINAIFDLSQIPAYSGGYNFRDAFKECSSLEEVRFVPNSILWMNYQLFNVSQVLSDNSLISIANGLAEGATQYNTITFLSTPKARCSTLMGNNNNGLFVANTNGSMSLADFITNVKGWTLN